MEFEQRRNGMFLVFIKRLRSLFLVPTLLFVTERSNAAKPVVFPLPPYREVLIVPVRMAGDDHLFVLDSGASTNVFDSDLKELLGEPLQRLEGTDVQGKQLKAEAFAPPVAHVG